jgi:nucleolar MIF4G domain-containing protein 1
MGLSDILNADVKGRWWKAGASWQGRTEAPASTSVPEATEQMKSSKEQHLLNIAKKLNMNTDTRRNVFMVIMNAYDINDAYDRLMRLDLRGKNDREIIRVLAECCSGIQLYPYKLTQLNHNTIWDIT